MLSRFSKCHLPARHQQRARSLEFGWGPSSAGDVGKKDGGRWLSSKPLKIELLSWRPISIINRKLHVPILASFSFILAGFCLGKTTSPSLAQSGQQFKKEAVEMREVLKRLSATSHDSSSQSLSMCRWWTTLPTQRQISCSAFFSSCCSLTCKTFSTKFMKAFLSWI